MKEKKATTKRHSLLGHWVLHCSLMSEVMLNCLISPALPCCRQRQIKSEAISNAALAIMTQLLLTQGARDPAYEQEFGGSYSFRIYTGVSVSS